MFPPAVPTPAGGLYPNIRPSAIKGFRDDLVPEFKVFEKA
jgi:hypothetical protein